MPPPSLVIPCPCGARLRAPAGVDMRVRCPSCGHVSSTGGASTAAVAAPITGASAVTLGERDRPSCPVCQANIGVGERAVRCDACAIHQHEECWAEVGGCGAYGCTNAPRAAVKQEIGQHASAPVAESTAWGDTKRCPACGEMIKSVALKCRYCSSDFDTVDPMTPDEYATRMVDGVRLKQVKSSAIGLFVFGLLGCVAPVTLIAGLIWTLIRHRDLKKLGTTYLVLAWTAVGLSALYTLCLVGAILLDQW
jgi:hypothetical protein